MGTIRIISVIIGFKNPPRSSDIEFIVGLGGKVKRTYTIIDAISADIPENAMETIRTDPNVEYIEIDERVFAHRMDNRVPVGTCQEIKTLKQMTPWGINRIGSRLVNAIGDTGKGIRISILDTGIDKDHEDLSKNFKGGYNFIDNNTDLKDLNGHGTHVAGIIAAEDNDIGVIGVAPDAHIYSVKVLDYAATGTASDMVAGIEWSLENNMQIVNMSLGADKDSISFGRAVENAYNSGVLLVAAAGNNGNIIGKGDNIDYPSKYDSVISVGAIDINDKRATFSSTGPSLEVSAPGVDILSTLPGNKYGILEGTSMASPHVSGVAALVMSNNPDMINTEIRIKLQITAQDIAKGISFSQAKNWFGYGLVDAPKAVSI